MTPPDTGAPPTEPGAKAPPADAGLPAAVATPGEGFEDRRALFAIASSSLLSGQKVAESKQGPWLVRATGGAGGRSGASAVVDADGDYGGVGLEGTGRGGGGMRMAEGETLSAAPRRKSVRAFGSAAMEPPSAPPPPSFAPGAPGASVPPSSANPLRAGSTDDNADFDAFLKFLATWTGKADLAQSYDPLDVTGRRWLKVVDAAGKPVPAALVQVVDLEQDKLLWAGTTYGDGRLPYYPRVAATRLGGAQPSAKLAVQAAQGEGRVRVEWDGAADLVLALPAERASGRLALDVVFAIDTTGSMGDEIQRVKETLAAVTRKLVGLDQEFDLRYGAVLFRDLGDEYVTSAHPFTSDLAAFGAALQQVRAAGGGDGPESVNQALAEVTRLDWRDGAAKVVFLIGDAPPHLDYLGDVRYGQSALAAMAQGIRIHAVAASGLDPLGTLVFRQVAQFTRGKFIFIEYGSTAASAESHGVTGSVSSNNLDDIIFAQIRDEIAHWGRAAPPAQVSEK